jgi:hypothetical protein
MRVQILSIHREDSGEVLKEEEEDNDKDNKNDYFETEIN